MRLLSIQETSQITGGTDTNLGTITVTGHRPNSTSNSQNEGVSSATWGIWDTMPDPPPMELHDQDTPIQPDDPVVLVVPTYEQQKAYLSTNIEFQHLADRIEAAILQNPNAVQAFYALIAGGGEVRQSDRTYSYFDGTNLNLVPSAMQGGAATGNDFDTVLHELGHFVAGFPNIRDYSDPYAYAVARAQSEVDAAIFAAKVELALGNAVTGLAPGEGTAYLENNTDKAASGNFTESDYVNWIGIVLNQGNGLRDPGDQNGDGVKNHLDQYLSDWETPSKNSYQQWLNGSP